MRLAYLLLLGPLLLATPGRAESLSFTGSLDPNNPNDVFLATFTVTSSSEVVIQSWGYGGTAAAPGSTNAAGTFIAPGGFDTYFSLFSGTGPTATFFASNDDGSCPPGTASPGCADSTLDLTLSAGSYTLALTQPNNFSIAENYGYGTLGDGFINLAGDYTDYYSGQLRTSDYAFDISGRGVTSGAAPPTVPEPSSLLLLSTGLFGASATAFRRRKNLVRRSLTSFLPLFAFLLVLPIAAHAQKPALSENTDEPGRNPWQQTRSVNCISSAPNCFLDFQATLVPTGYRLVITHIVALGHTTATSGITVGLAGSQFGPNAPTPFAADYLPVTSGGISALNSSCLFYIEAGQAPLVSFGGGYSKDISATLTGYLIKL